MTRRGEKQQTRAADQIVTLSRLLELLHYNPDTGIFVWRKTNSNRAPAGKVAGGPAPSGYISIAIDDQDYRAHRLAWFYMTGRWPFEVDHKNMIVSDNRWSNLRESDVYLNKYNTGPRRHNSSGFKGVTISPRASGPDRWAARLQVRGKNLYLGVYDTPEEAHAAYCAALLKVAGEFARLQ